MNAPERASGEDLLQGNTACIHSQALIYKFKAFLNLSSDTLRIISLATEHLKINLRMSYVLRSDYGYKH